MLVPECGRYADSFSSLVGYKFQRLEKVNLKELPLAQKQVLVKRFFHVLRNRHHQLIRFTQCGHYQVTRAKTKLSCPRCYEMWWVDRWLLDRFIRTGVDKFRWPADPLREFHEL